MSDLQELQDHFISLLPEIVGDRREIIASHIYVIGQARDLIKSQAAEINNHLAETLNLSSEIEGLQLELTAALNFEEMYDDLKLLAKELFDTVDAWSNTGTNIELRYGPHPEYNEAVKMMLASKDAIREVLKDE